MPKLPESKSQLATAVNTITLEAVKRMSKHLGISQGELIDDAVAGLVGAFADTQLEEGEVPLRSDPLTAEKLDEATTRVPITEDSEADKMMAEPTFPPTGRDVRPAELAHLDVVAPPAGQGKATVETYQRPFKAPLLKPGEKGKR